MGHAAGHDVDPTFYRSPADAISAPPEQLAYVVVFDRAAQWHDHPDEADVRAPVSYQVRQESQFCMKLLSPYIPIVLIPINDQNACAGFRENVFVYGNRFDSPCNRKRLDL